MSENRVVSVVIPCYNLGQYLDEAVQSVLAQTYQHFEIVIVDDGSTERLTLDILQEYNHPKIKVLRTTNQGLACARNNGIAETSGDYILPLDADDRIGPAYLAEAVAILEKHQEIGIVYCLAEFFGSLEGRWDLPDFNLPRMMVDNLIFCSGLFRRSDWLKTSGYDPAMRYGWEDYDFWLSLLELGVQVYRLPTVHFYYRRRFESMIYGMTPEQLVYSYTYLFKKHSALYTAHISTLFEYMVRFRQRMEQLEIENNTLQLKLNQIEHELSATRQERSYLRDKLIQVEIELQKLRATRTVRLSQALGKLINRLRKG